MGQFCGAHDKAGQGWRELETSMSVALQGQELAALGAAMGSWDLARVRGAPGAGQI